MKPQTQTAKHTKTPWETGILMTTVIAQRPEGWNVDLRIADCHVNDLRESVQVANAEFICQAVNQHDQLIAQRDALLEAAKRLLARLRNETARIETCDMAPSTEQAIEQGESAIALCEPKEKE